LYDIANVFKSLGLIQKTAIQGTKKPAFEWVGKKGVERFAEKIIGEKGGEIHEQKEDENVQGNLIKP
jgi:transcription factor E2F7/8